MPRAMSMEEFGPISVDWFIQRKVEKITHGENDAVWSIHFEGNGILHNFDPLLPEPTAIVGAGLTHVILGGHWDSKAITELRFGLENVILNPLEYAMVDPNFTKGNLVFAQRSDANMPTLPPHPDERVADGPDNDE